jgi:hypothetical protein
MPGRRGCGKTSASRIVTFARIGRPSDKPARIFGYSPPILPEIDVGWRRRR